MKEEGPLDEHFDVNPNSAHHEDQGQMIYFVKIRIAYKVRRGNGYVNYYRTMELPTRMKSIEDMNSSPEMILNMMASFKLTGKKIFDFHVSEELSRQPLSRSFTHKESEYGKEIKK